MQLLGESAGAGALDRQEEEGLRLGAGECWQRAAPKWAPEQEPGKWDTELGSAATQRTRRDWDQRRTAWWPGIHTAQRRFTAAPTRTFDSGDNEDWTCAERLFLCFKWELCDVTTQGYCFELNRKMFRMLAGCSNTFILVAHFAPARSTWGSAVLNLVQVEQTTL